MYCYEKPVFSIEQLEKLGQDELPSPEFLASVFHAASDDYFFHWMASFISNEHQRVFELSKDRQELWPWECTAATYFALSQLKRNGTGNAPDARLYFSIHHLYHSFRCDGKAPTQDSWLLSWTEFFLKESLSGSTLLEDLNRLLLSIHQDTYSTKRVSKKKSTTANGKNRSIVKKRQQWTKEEKTTGQRG